MSIFNKIKKISDNIEVSLTDEQQECIDNVWEDNFLELTKEEWRTNRGFVLAALKKDGKILGLLSEDFRKDREIVLEAVKSFGSVYEDALKYADEKLQFDPEIILEGINSSFKSEGDISLSEENFQIFINEKEIFDPYDVIKDLTLKIRYTVLKQKKKDFDLFLSRLKTFINSNHECFWLLQVVYMELINIQHNILGKMDWDVFSSFYGKTLDWIIMGISDSVLIGNLEFSPNKEFDTYFIDNEINYSWDDCKWSDSSNGEGMNFSEFIMKRAQIEWNSDTCWGDNWSDSKYYNYGISSLWIGLLNYTLRHLEENLNEENTAIALYSVIDEKYVPIQESGNGWYGTNVFRIVTEFLLGIKQNEYDLTIDDVPLSLEEFYGYQYDLKRVANNICNRDLFDSWPGASVFLDD
jgi:hypothetical protein